ncbi:hypothetical protein [Anoxybacillus gonensis]|uniref:hypothetical protein n=1 Tax=Anoxybacillus gonensis TaxID=198467 RepID=UPI0002BD7F34|nr:hypothetical protein [Anoxybacillus gonensis]EMI11243.1 hypothetical protein F510_0656 [Anoxybacillus gonensis]
MSFKPRQEKYTSESGKEYLFQSVPPSSWAQILDQITDKHGKLLNSKAIPAMLEHVIVQPAGLNMDDFEEWAELEEVAQAAFRFQQQRKR